MTRPNGMQRAQQLHSMSQRADEIAALPTAESLWETTDLPTMGAVLSILAWAGQNPPPGQEEEAAALAGHVAALEHNLGPEEALKALTKQIGPIPLSLLRGPTQTVADSLTRHVLEMMGTADDA